MRAFKIEWEGTPKDLGIHRLMFQEQYCYRIGEPTVEKSFTVKMKNNLNNAVQYTKD